MRARILSLLLLLLLWPLSPAQATITSVQTPATSATTSITLNGVTAGNTLVLLVSWFRDPTTGAVHPTPTDSSGDTVQVAVAGTPSNYNGSFHYDLGSSIFYVTNASAGTHTFTLAAMSDRHSTLAEFSPMTVSSFDVATSALTNGPASATSQVTGTTATTAQANELVVIACTVGSTTGGFPDIGWTDPVSGFTTLQKVIDLSSQLPTLHAWKEVSSVGTQSATFNWTANPNTIFTQAAIATFKVPMGGNSSLMLMGVGQ